MGQAPLELKLNMAGVTPVSYTHLDVYKRQDTDGGGEPDRGDRRANLYLSVEDPGSGMHLPAEVYRGAISVGTVQGIEQGIGGGAGKGAGK